KKKQIQRFLGMAGFCRRYIKDYAKIVNPITDLLKNDAEWRWGDEEKKAWDTIKGKMTTAPVLRQPVLDQEYTLITDASKHGLGAVLCREDEKRKLPPIAYISRKLRDQKCGTQRGKWRVLLYT